MQPIKIEIKIVDLKDRKDSVMTECYILLSEKWLEYKAVGTYESLSDETGIWENQKANYRFMIKKEYIAYLSMSYSNYQDKYYVSIFADAIEHYSVYFDSPKEALVVYNKLREWLIT